MTPPAPPARGPHHAARSAPSSGQGRARTLRALGLCLFGLVGAAAAQDRPTPGDGPALTLFDHGPAAAELLAERPRPLGQLTPQQQAQLNKLVAKWEKVTARIAVVEAKLAVARQELSDAKRTLDEAENMPIQTIWDWLEQQKLTRAANKRIKKWSKRLEKLQRKLDKLLERLAELVAAIEAIDPDYFEPEDPGGGDPGGGGSDPGGGDPGGGDPGGGGGGGGAPDPDPEPDPHEDPVSGSLPVGLFIQEARPRNTSGVSRPGAVATFGVPFSESQEVGLTGGRPALAVQGADAYQFSVLESWPGGRVKWALLSVQTDVSAGQITEGLDIVAGSGTSGEPDVATETASAVELDTGPLQATILESGFNLFRSVTVDGVTLVDSASEPGLYGRTIGGQLLTPANIAVTVEQNGPVRALVRVDGVLENPGGVDVIDFSVRIAAVKDSRDLEVTLTVRNANIQRNQHTVVDSIELAVPTSPGSDRTVWASRHDGSYSASLGSGQLARLYQAKSSAPTTDVYSGNYRPHLPKPGGVYLEHGYELVVNGSTIQALGNEDLYAEHSYLDLTGSAGGVTVAIEKMAYQWPAALEAHDDGRVVAGVFTARNPADYTFVWQQHESRTAVFSFHAGPASSPHHVAKRLDYPVTGRCADYGQYDDSGAFPYRLLTHVEHNHALALMGINHQVGGNNPDRLVRRYLYKGTTGGMNNHAGIEVSLGGEWLRYGMGGHYLNGLDLALYKAEWQIERSDNFSELDDPGPTNNSLPTTTGQFSDDEHRYREGIILAYHLTGDTRLKESIEDEVEVLQDVYLWPHERSMYQTLRAMAYVIDFTDDATLRNVMRNRLEYITAPTIDVDTEDGGWGWEAAPDAGSRRYFVDSTQNQNEMPPGEEFQARGFISASLGPLGYFHAARVLDASDPLEATSRGRMRDLSWWTRHELFPYDPNPANQRLAYSYAVTLQQVTVFENVDFHPILLGQAESFLDTGDVGYLAKGVEQLRAAYEHGDIDNWDVRLDCQHFMAVWREWYLSQ